MKQINDDDYDDAAAADAKVLEKIIRNVALARPIHVCRFIADFLDSEISRRTFDDVVYGCHLKKTLKRQPYPSESCAILHNFLLCQARKGLDDTQFLRGAIPQYELAPPALDRYRDYAGVGDFEMDDEAAKAEGADKAEPEDESVAFPETACIPERDIAVPALDRYRDYAGIGPFDPDDVSDDCFYHKKFGPLPNCKCTFCTLKVSLSLPDFP